MIQYIAVIKINTNYLKYFSFFQKYFHTEKYPFDETDTKYFRNFHSYKYSKR